MNKEEAEKVAQDAATYFRFFTEIGIIDQLISTRIERLLPHNLTLSQFSVLNHFSRGLPAKSPNELASAFQVTKGAMTNTLKQLDAKGFVNIVPNENDGRSKIVSASEQGLEAHRDAQAEIAAALSEIIDIFPADEMQTQIPYLERMRIWLDNNR